MGDEEEREGEAELEINNAVNVVFVKNQWSLEHWLHTVLGQN